MSGLLFFSPPDIILIALSGGAAATSLILAASLLLRRSRGFSVFGIFLIAVTATMINRMLANAGILSQRPALYFIPIEFSWSFGPLLWLSIQTLVKNRRLERGDLVHLLLPFLQLVLFLSIGFRSEVAKSDFWVGFYGPWFQYADQLIFSITLFSYALASLRVLKRENFLKAPTWLRSISRSLQLVARALLSYGIVDLIYGISSTLAWELAEINLYNIAWYAVPGNMVLVILSYSISMLGLFSLRDGFDHEMLELRAGKLDLNKYRELMESQKLYLMSDLTMQSFCRFAGISESEMRNLLSASGLRFVPWLNSFRIDEFTRLIKAGRHKEETLLGVALDCGFGSKASFNRIIRSELGQTPSDYIEATENV